MTTLIPFCTILPWRKWISKSCVLSRTFISIYKINRTLHDRLGIRILSSSAESISHEWAKRTSEKYFQHEKIKFVSPSGHVISSISIPLALRLISRFNCISTFAAFLVFGEQPYFCISHCFCNFRRCRNRLGSISALLSVLSDAALFTNHKLK